MTPAEYKARLAKQKPNKYRAKRSESALIGRSFASQAERRRGEELALLEKAGAIRNLCFQVPVPCVVNGAPVCKWVADFVYEEKDPKRGWVNVFEDCKGFPTDVYKLKKKILAANGIQIRETR